MHFQNTGCYILEPIPGMFDGESPWNQIGYAKRETKKPQVAAAYLLLDFFKQKKDHIGLYDTRSCG